MRASKSKKIKKAFKDEKEEKTFIYHYKPFINIRGEVVGRFVAQMVNVGKKRLEDLGKTIYNISKVTPKEL